MDGFGDDPALPFAGGDYEAQLDDSFRAASKEFSSAFRDGGAIESPSGDRSGADAPSDPNDPTEWIRRAGRNPDGDKS